MGIDNVREQRKLDARKPVENGNESPPSRARVVKLRPAIVKPHADYRRSLDRVGWVTNTKLQRLRGGITCSQSAGFHQFLRLAQIAFMLSLDRASEE